MDFTPYNPPGPSRGKPPINKVMTASEAISKFVHEDTYLGISGTCYPTNLMWEIVRQKDRIKSLDLAVCSQIGLSAPIIGSGLVRKLEFAYVWGGLEGEDKVFRRAVEKGIPRPIELEEYSNYGMGMRWNAGALGLPFMPTKSQLGSDIIKYNPRIKVIDDPYDGKPVALVPASNPDVSIIHATRADEIGNVQFYGIYGNSDMQARASKHVIVSVEEIVPQAELQRLPNLTVIPFYYVDAVVLAPFGAHWREAPFYYHHDLAFGLDAFKQFRTQEGFDAWVEKYILGTKDWYDYLKLVGYDRLFRLKQSEQSYQKYGEVR